MGLAIFMFLILVFITFINYLINGKEYISPSVIFSAGFAFSSFWLVIFAKKWNLYLGFNTFFVIVFGNIIFSVVCKVINEIYKKRKRFSDGNNGFENKNLKEIIIDKYKINVFLIFSIIINILTLYYTVKAVNGSFSNIGNALYAYRNITAYKGESLNIPGYIEILSGVLHASFYWFLYVFINNMLVKKKISLKILIIIILSAISSVLDGSRGAIINSILAIIPIFYFLKIKKNGYKSNLKLKNVLLIICLLVILISTLKWTATALGRNDINEIKTIDYIAMYTGAEIKNLDTYLSEKKMIETNIGIHTFRTIYESLSKYANKKWEMDIVALYRNVNGYNLGNVYTIFFDFVCDLGYIGILIFTPIMAIISQILYEKSKNSIVNNNHLPISVIMYSFAFGGIVFAFFGNKFFPQVISFGFVKYIILWYLYNWFFCKIKIKY